MHQVSTIGRVWQAVPTTRGAYALNFSSAGIKDWDARRKTSPPTSAKDVGFGFIWRVNRELFLRSENVILGVGFMFRDLLPCAAT